jgi:molybdopterin converting factor small subunit
MSTIIVELRSQLSVIFGKDRFELHFDGSQVSVGAILERLLAANPGSESAMHDRRLLNGRLPKAMFVANDRVLHAESQLRDGDTLKVFPHIFGG